MASWKTERSYAGKSPNEVFQATKQVIERMAGKYGLKHQGNEASLSGTVSGMGVDGKYKAAGEKMTIELSYGFLVIGPLRQKVQDEVVRQLDKLFA
jgi:hypothetical protein